MAASGEMDDRKAAVALRHIMNDDANGWDDCVAKARELFGPSPEMLAVCKILASADMSCIYVAMSGCKQWSVAEGEAVRLFLMAWNAYRLTLQPPKRYRVEPENREGSFLVTDKDGQVWARCGLAPYAERICRLLEADKQP